MNQSMYLAYLHPNRHPIPKLGSTNQQPIVCIDNMAEEKWEDVPDRPGPESSLSRLDGGFTEITSHGVV